MCCYQCGLEKSCISWGKRLHRVGGAHIQELGTPQKRICIFRCFYYIIKQAQHAPPTLVRVDGFLDILAKFLPS